MKKALCTFALILATLPQAQAGAFHDCGVNPIELKPAVHLEHGGNCGNDGTQGQQGETGTQAYCDGGCVGSMCPFGQWESHLSCDYVGGQRVCAMYGTLRCGGTGAGWARTYAIACGGAGGNWPVMLGTPAQARCTYLDSNYNQQTVQCDCYTTNAYWAANCGG